MEFLTFKFEDNDLRALFYGKKLWFDGRDLCDVLQIRRSKRALASITQWGKHFVETGQPPDVQKEIFVAYHSALHMVRNRRTRVAKRLKHWMFKEVPTVESWLHEHASNPNDAYNNLAADYADYRLRIKMNNERRAQLEVLDAQNDKLFCKLVKVREILNINSAPTK